MFDFSKIFSFSVDIFASSDIGGVNDEAEDPHDRGAVQCPWQWLWEGPWAGAWRSLQEMLSGAGEN